MISFTSLGMSGTRCSCSLLLSCRNPRTSASVEEERQWMLSQTDKTHFCMPSGGKGCNLEQQQRNSNKDSSTPPPNGEQQTRTSKGFLPKGQDSGPKAENIPGWHLEVSYGKPKTAKKMVDFGPIFWKLPQNFLETSRGWSGHPRPDQHQRPPFKTEPGPGPV